MLARYFGGGSRAVFTSGRKGLFLRGHPARQSRKLLFPSNGRFFSTQNESVQRAVQALQNPSSKSIEELSSLRKEVLKGIRDDKVAEAFAAAELSLTELSNLLKADFSELEAPINWDFYARALPGSENLLAAAKKLIANVPEDNFEVSFPPLEKLKTELAQHQQKVQSHFALLEQQTNTNVQQLQKQYDQIKEYLLQLDNLTGDRDTKGGQFDVENFEELILQHEWDEDDVELVEQPVRLESERQVLAELLGSGHPLVAEYNGDLKLLISKLTEKR